MIISKKRILSTEFLNNYNLEELQIGIEVTNEEYKKLDLEEFEEGRIIQPSPVLGINCERNAYGYSYPDKTKPKEYRVVNTIEWVLYDWGGYEHKGFTDISKYVYPKINIEAANVELILTKNIYDKKFILAKMNKETKKKFLKQTINIFLEIFGFCEIFTKNLNLICIDNKIKKCN